MEDSVDVVEMFPDESADLRVSWGGFIPTVLDLIMGQRSFDARVVHKGLRRVWYFRLQDENDVGVEYRNGSCPSLRYSRQSYCSYRGLNGGEITRRRI